MIYGLVLCGGQSSRMGEDKGSIVYDMESMKNQRTRCYDAMSVVCDLVFVSCRSDQESDIDPIQLRVVDSVGVPGPAGGILSAHALVREAAWMVLACDFPFADESAVRYLAKFRQPRKAATVYYRAEQDIREPLFAIWESRALEELKKRSALGDYSPRQTLNGLDCELIRAPCPTILVNVNSPAERFQSFRPLV